MNAIMNERDNELHNECHNTMIGWMLDLTCLLTRLDLTWLDLTWPWWIPVVVKLWQNDSQQIHHISFEGEERGEDRGLAMGVP